MHPNTEIINQFYTAFANGDAVLMNECYHEDVQFEDPAFGQLKGQRAFKMWEMLLSNPGTELQISFDQVRANESHGSARWVATYKFGKKKRPVINEIQAKFEFRDGKIIQHQDHFNLWKWSKQALGLTGFLLGWSGFWKRKIQKTTQVRLNHYISKSLSR